LPNGELIILMADHQTTGYQRVAQPSRLITYAPKNNQEIKFIFTCGPTECRKSIIATTSSLLQLHVLSNWKFFHTAHAYNWPQLRYGGRDGTTMRSCLSLALLTSPADTMRAMKTAWENDWVRNKHDVAIGALYIFLW
jgi:hypothetical protein